MLALECAAKCFFGVVADAAGHSPTPSSVVASRSSARCMRHSVKYRIGDLRSTSRKRASSNERDTATRRASSETVQCCSGALCSHDIAECNTGSLTAASQPWSAAGAEAK